MANLVHLPPELRNSIYGQLLSQATVHGNPNGLALFTVSKEFHLESTSYFYQHNDIPISVPSTITDTATILPPIADRYLRYLRRLTLYTTIGYVSAASTLEVANTIASLATIGASFEEIHIHIRSPLSKLLNSRVDDSVLHADHPITVALHKLLRAGVVGKTHIHLKNVWFAPNTAVALKSQYDGRLEFYTAGKPNTNPHTLERRLTGWRTTSHLTLLGLDDSDISDIDSGSVSSRSSSLSPSPLTSSRCSAFGELDSFPVVPYELDADDNETAGNGESSAQADSPMQAFFTEDDIEEWQTSTQECEQSDSEGFGDVDTDIDLDEEMEDISQDEMDAIIGNLEETAHHIANEADMTYLTNFAPDLLLMRHNLGHLVSQ